jgi:hypothetical protein
MQSQSGACFVRFVKSGGLYLSIAIAITITLEKLRQSECVGNSIAHHLINRTILRKIENLFSIVAL